MTISKTAAVSMGKSESATTASMIIRATFGNNKNGVGGEEEVKPLIVSDEAKKNTR